MTVPFGGLSRLVESRDRKNEEIDKGDFPGHPFRGNQWTKGAGGTTSAARLATGETLKGKGSPAQLKAMALAGGFTYNPKRNEIRAVGVASAVDEKHEKKISAKEFEANGEEVIKDYVRKNAEVLSQPNTHLGAWRETTPTSDNIYLDVSTVKGSVKAAADVGRATNQIGIYDLGNNAEYTRHMSPTTGQYKYLRSGTDVSNPRWVDTFGKADGDKGVLLIPAESIDDATIPAIVQRILELPPARGARKVKKDMPSVSDVHVPTVMRSKKKRKKRRRTLSEKKMLMDAALRKGDFPGHPFRGNQWTQGRGGALGGHLGIARELGSVRESNTTQVNDNPMTAAAQENLGKLGSRISLEEMRERRAQVIEQYDSMGKATKQQKDRYCKEIASGGRKGGELGRGNNKMRAKRKKNMLKSHGDGHTAGCSFCGIRVGFKTMEVEKLDPVMGYNTPKNLTPSCRGCNASLGNKSARQKMGVKFKRPITRPKC